MRHSYEGKKRINRTDLSAAFTVSPLALAVLISIGFASPLVGAETTLPSSSSTVTLQSFAPGEFDFVLPNGSLIQTAAGNGIDGDSSQDWQLNVQGSVVAAADGIHLLSATNNGAQITNSGSISAGGVGIALLNGGSIVNEAGGSIVGSTGILFSSGGYSLSNAGRIEGSGVGLEITTDTASTFTNQSSGIIAGNAGVHIVSSGHTVINQGMILGTAGTAVDISGNNNLLLLDDGATVVGDVNSSGTGNRIVLAGSGSIGGVSSVISGFSSLEMNGLAWTLAGDVYMGNSSPSISVNQGKLTLTGNLNANSGNVEVALGAELQIGDGGIVGDLQQAHIQADGVVSFFRSDGALDLTDRVFGSGVLLFKGTGVRGESYYSFSNGDSEFYGNIVVGNNVRLRIGSSSPAPLAHYFVENNSTLWFGSSGNFSSALYIEGQGWDDPGFGRLGALRLDSGPNVSGPVTLTGDARVTAVFSGYTGTISGSIGDGGNGYALEKTGDGLITLTGVNTYSGGTLINAGTLAIGRSESLGNDAGDVTLNHANATLSLLDSFSLNHNVTVGSQGGIVTTSSTNTITGTLSGDGTFTKAGTGSLSLTGAGSGVQNLSVLGGELALAQSGVFTTAGNYMTASGAATSLSDTASLAVNGQFTQSSGSTLNLALGSADPLINANIASLDGALNVTGLGPNVPNTASALTSTQYTLIHTAAAGGISGDFASVNLGGANSSVDYVLLYGGKSANGQDYSVGFELTWLADEQNGNGIFTLANAADRFNVDVALGDRSGVFASGWDGKTLTKEGAGTLVLSQVNAYGGPTLINQGTVETGIANALGGSDVFIDGDGALNLNGFSQRIGDLTGSGGVVLGSAALTVDARTDALFAGAISGTGAFIKEGARALTLSGDSDYSGGTWINGGALILNGANALGSGVVTNDATLTLSFLSPGSMGNTFAGGGTLIQDGSVAAMLTGDNSSTGRVEVNSGELAFAQQGEFSVISDVVTQSGATTSIEGSARLDVGGQFTMNGQLSLLADGNSGVSQPIISANSAALGSDSTFVLGGLSLSPTNNVASMGRAAFQVIGTSAPGRLSGDFSSISMGGAASPVDYVTFTGGVDPLRQNYDIGLSLTWYEGYTSTPEKAHGTFTLSDQREFFNLGVVLLDVAENGATGWDGKSLTKAGQGTLVLSKQNQYTGDTLIQGGILRLEAENAVADSARVQISDGAMLITGEADQLIHQLNGSGRIILGQGLLTQHNEGGTTLFSGQISGLGSLKKTGDGTLILSADDDFVGTTTVAEGVLQLGDGGSTGGVIGDIVNDAALVFNRSSDLTYGGTISGSGQVTQAGSNLLTLTGNSTYSADTVINGGELRLGAGGNSGSVAGNIVNHGILTFNRADDVRYLGAVSGEGVVNKMGSGALTFSQSQSYQGDTTVSEGTLIVGDDGHPDVTLDSRKIDVLAGATLGGYGQVNGSVNSRGTLAVADALPEFADRQTGSFTVGGDLNNAGRIVMASVDPDSRLIVKGNYLGEGGALALSAALAGDDSATDRLVILGDSGGSTSVVVNNAGGKGGQTVNGIQIVSVAGKSDGVFTLANRPVAGAYDYFLYRGTPSENDGNWYLRSVLNQQDAVVRPEAGSYVANAAAAGTLFALRLTDRDIGEKNGGMWLRQVGGHTRSRDDSGQLRTQTNRYVVQGGGDLFSLPVGGEGSLSGGVMAGYGHTSSSTGSTMSGYDAKGSLNGYSTGIYSTWRQNAAAQRGAYLDAWLQYSWFKASVGGQGLSDERYNINGYSASVESGYRYVVSESATGALALTPQLQAVWSGIKADDHTESNGTVVKSLNDDALQTRVGVELSRRGVSREDRGDAARFTAYVEANWLYNRKPTAVALDGVAVRQQGDRNVGELKVGVKGALSARWDLWGNIGQRLGDDGYSGTSASLAVRYRF